MDFILYGFPIFVFIVLSVVMYSISSEENKDQFVTKHILPSAIVSILLFLIIKFKDSQVFNSEPMKTGNYFDHTSQPL
jgi:hypothetical protein